MFLITGKWHPPHSVFSHTLILTPNTFPQKINSVVFISLLNFWVKDHSSSPYNITCSTTLSNTFLLIYIYLDLFYTIPCIDFILISLIEVFFWISLSSVSRWVTIDPIYEDLRFLSYWFIFGGSGHLSERKISRTNAACPCKGSSSRTSVLGCKVYCIAFDIPWRSGPEEKFQVVFLGTADVTMRW